uniref:Uncharacterized protein n=1 Tax=viral metagenome TaxID=1070528 RepID=A0A6M3KB56_9ZZZZ
MPSTLLTLRTAVTDALGNTGTKAVTWADRALNYAQLLAALIFDPPELKVTDDLTLAISGSSVSLSTLTRLRAIETIYNSTSSKRMWPLSWDKWYILAPATVGDAIYYCRRSETLHTAPIPTVANTLRTHYYKYPAALTVTDDTLDFDNHDSFIVNAAIKLAWAFQEETENVDMMNKVGEAIGIPLAMGTKLRHDLEEGIREQYNISGAQA